MTQDPDRVARPRGGTQLRPRRQALRAASQSAGARTTIARARRMVLVQMLYLESVLGEKEARHR